MQNQIKICKKCRHYDGSISLVPTCRHDKAYYGINMVNGNERFHTCNFMRYYNTLCGPEGKLFKSQQLMADKSSKQSMFKRIRNMLCKIR